MPAGPGLTNNDVGKLYKQIGNAVPVKLASVVAQPVADFYATLSE